MCSHKRKQVKAVEAQEDISDEDYCTAPCIMVGTVAPHKYATIHFKETDFPCIIDTGAQVNVMAQTTYKLLGQPNLLLPQKKLYPYGPEKPEHKKPLPVLGIVKGQFTCPSTKQKIVTEFYAMQGQAQNLLSRTSSTALGLIHFTGTLNVVNTDPAADLIKQYADIALKALGR